MVVHVTAAPAITLPLWSRTSALSWTVAPNAVSSTLAGLTVTAVGRAGSGGGGGAGPAVSSFPHPMSNAAIRPSVPSPAKRIVTDIFLDTRGAGLAGFGGCADALETVLKTLDKDGSGVLRCMTPIVALVIRS